MMISFGTSDGDMSRSVTNTPFKELTTAEEY